MTLEKHLHWFAIAPTLLSGVLLALITWSPIGVHDAKADSFFAFSSPDVSTSPESCDLNGDTKHDFFDVAVLKLYWSGFPDHEVDCSADGSIDARDLAILMSTWDGASPLDVNLPIQTGAPVALPGYGYHLALPPAPATGRKVGDKFTALLLLTTGDTPIGAGEAIINYDKQHLSVKEVRTNPSIWTVWTERPHPPFRNGQLVFAGGRPNGFVGSQGTLAAIQFEVIGEGEEQISVSPDSRAYKSDAAGTKSYLNVFSTDANAPVFGITASTTKSLPPVLYYGVLPVEQAPSSFNTGPEHIDPVRAPTLTGQAWVVDLSPLSPDGGARSYEVRELWYSTVLQDEVYKLRDSSPGPHFLQVNVRGPDDTDWTANVIVTVPGEVGSRPFWDNLGLWIAVELTLAILVTIIVWRRHVWRVRRDTIVRARLRSA